MELEDKIVKAIIRDVKNDALYQNESLSREVFSCYLRALHTKLMVSIKKSNKASKNAQQQLGDIEWMQRALERQKYIHLVHNSQSKFIGELHRQLVKLEFENSELRDELINLKKNILNNEI